MQWVLEWGIGDNDRVIGTSLPGRSSRKIGLIWPTRWWPPSLYLFGCSLNKVVGICPSHA